MKQFTVYFKAPAWVAPHVRKVQAASSKEAARKMRQRLGKLLTVGGTNNRTLWFWVTGKGGKRLHKGTWRR